MFVGVALFDGAEFILSALGMWRADFPDMQRELLRLHIFAKFGVLSQSSKPNPFQADCWGNCRRWDLSSESRGGRDYQFRARLRGWAEFDIWKYFRRHKKNSCDDFTRANQYQYQRRLHGGHKKNCRRGLGFNASFDYQRGRRKLSTLLSRRLSTRRREKFYPLRHWQKYSRFVEYAVHARL